MSILNVALLSLILSVAYVARPAAHDSFDGGASGKEQDPARLAGMYVKSSCAAASNVVP